MARALHRRPIDQPLDLVTIIGRFRYISMFPFFFWFVRIAFVGFARGSAVGDESFSGVARGKIGGANMAMCFSCSLSFMREWVCIGF